MNNPALIYPAERNIETYLNLARVQISTSDPRPVQIQLSLMDTVALSTVKALWESLKIKLKGATLMMEPQFDVQAKSNNNNNKIWNSSSETVHSELQEFIGLLSW